MATVQSIEAEQLSKLREYIESLGGRLDGGWRCRANIRDFGSRAGSLDTWFTAPHGETFRSKVAVARGLGLDTGGAPKPRAPRRPVDPDRPRPVRPPKPPKSEGGAAEGSVPPSERTERGGSRGPGGGRGSKAPAAPKVKRPRGWNTWTPSEKWQDDPIIDADPAGHLVMGDLAELLLAMPEADHADEM
jgi:hypothetical protein